MGLGFDSPTGHRATYGADKKEADMTKDEFMQKAKSIEVIIDGQKFIASPKTFSTGSVGWTLNAKGGVKVGDDAVKVQLGGNFIVANSKDWK